jgi:hypothetical protein
VTYQTGQDAVVRTQFVNNGVLSNTEDINFRAVSDDWPVFAFAHDLGAVSTTTTDPVICTVGHVRDPAIQYIIADDVYQPRSVYFWSAYSSVTALVRTQSLLTYYGCRKAMFQIAAFIGDYSTALSRAQVFDEMVSSDASAISSNYAGIVALSIRQAFGALELTLSKNSDGSWNTDDVLMFLKGTL